MAQTPLEMSREYYVPSQSASRLLPTQPPLRAPFIASLSYAMSATATNFISTQNPCAATTFGTNALATSEAPNAITTP